MNVNKREEIILKLLSEEGEISVQALSEKLKVSQVTIRSDLNNLSNKQLIIRTRGGAISASHPIIREQQNQNPHKKEAIAKKAAELVNEGDSVMICNGTTSALIARHLLLKKNLHIVTNSTLILPYARVNTGLQVTFVGGEFRPQTEGVVGPIAERQLREYHVSIAFLGTDGITLEHGLTTALPENAEVLRTMCAQADKTVLVADSSKFGKKGFVRILPIEGIDVLITDKDFPVEALEKMKELGVQVLTV